jgi:hypothetical protein
MPADGTLAARSSATISACPASRAARQNLAHFSRLRNGSHIQAHVLNGIMAVNAKDATALGLTALPTPLIRADEVYRVALGMTPL